MKATDAPTPATVPTGDERAKPPLCRRPGFWTVTLLLVMLLYGGWAFWLQWRERQARQDVYAAALAHERERHASLEARREILRDALKKDPCAARQALRNLSPVGE